MPWTAANYTVAAAALEPAIAAALAELDRVDAAILSGDAAGFAASFAPEAWVNGPTNSMVCGADAGQAFALGFIDYASFERRIEHLALRPTGEVLVMGEETVTPRNKAPHAGKTLRRRFTEVLRLVDGQWRQSIRQATIIAID